MWNICTHMESAGGDRQIRRSRQKPGAGPQIPNNTTSPHYIDRQEARLASEGTKRLNITAAKFQETKWFWSDVWNAEGHTVLHSRRPIPDQGDPQRRNEGLGILLDRCAATAWKDAGDSWEAISSRVVTARLKVRRYGQRRCGGSSETRDTYMTVVSAYTSNTQSPSRNLGQIFE